MNPISEKDIIYVSLASEKTINNSIHSYILEVFSKNVNKLFVLCHGQKYVKEEGNITYLSGSFKDWLNYTSKMPSSSLIFATDFFVGGAFAVYLKKKKKNSRLVLRAASPWVYNGFSPTTLIKRLILQVTKPLVIKNSDKVIYNSKSLIQHQYKHDYEVIYNGVDTKLFKPIKVESLTTKLNLIAMGNINKEKGLDYLFEAVKDMTDRIHLSIVGDGPLLEMYQSKYPFAKYYGRVEHKYLPLIINQHDILVHPSYVESMPNVVLEALACGKFVIACDVYGLNEIIEEGKNGYLVEANNVVELKNLISKIINYSLKTRLKLKPLNYLKHKFERGTQIQMIYNYLRE
ncbi:glycosyltransferase family 4 protein [Candidatus Woesearchaeota archaeon]|nr:glycosyltransferase family 4 protein [Candidatus Woesearchaeota archaeon]